MNAVLGIKGEVVAGANGDQLMRVGITCALCHSSVDDSVMPGIGHRVDGAPNVDLDPGAIIALSPAVTADRSRLHVGGKGKYDPRYNGDGMNNPVVIPPAYGLKDSPHATYSGDGDIRYWNNYVAVTQMGGQGTFVDARIGVNKTLPAGRREIWSSRSWTGCARTSSAWACPTSMPILEKTVVTGDAVAARRCSTIAAPAATRATGAPTTR